MAKKRGEDFSLIINHNGNTQTVGIPFSLEDIDDQIEVRRTYQIVIDAFTTQFANEEELLEYIRQQGLARIKSIHNKDLTICMKYTGERNFTGNTQLAFSNSKHLIEFISTHPKVSYSYPDFYQQFLHELIDGFDHKNEYSNQFREFMLDSNAFFDRSFTNQLNYYYKIGGFDKTYREEVYGEYGRNIEEQWQLDTILDSLFDYHNIRGYLLSKDHLLEILQEKKEDNIPFYERFEPENRHGIEENSITENNSTPKTEGNDFGLDTTDNEYSGVESLSLEEIENNYIQPSTDVLLDDSDRESIMPSDEEMEFLNGYVGEDYLNIQRTDIPSYEIPGDDELSDKPKRR